MHRSITGIRQPDDLVAAVDERAAALGVTRSQLVIRAVEQALEARWSAIGSERIRLPWSDEINRSFGERTARLAKGGGG